MKKYSNGVLVKNTAEGEQNMTSVINSTHLARKNVSKSRKCIIKGFVVDAFIQVLDENISYT